MSAQDYATSQQWGQDENPHFFMILNKALLY